MVRRLYFQWHQPLTEVTNSRTGQSSCDGTRREKVGKNSSLMQFVGQVYRAKNDHNYEDTNAAKPKMVETEFVRELR